MLDKIRSFKWGYLLLFILLAAAGICFLAFNNTLSVIAIVLGVLLSLYGIVILTLTLANRSRSASFAFRIVISTAAIICGITTAVLREGAMEIIASLICLFIIIDGSFKLQTTSLSKRYNMVSWWLMLIPSILCIAGGFISLRLTPRIADESGVVFVSVLIGITLIIDAISNILSAFYITGYERNMKDEIEAEIYEKLEDRKAEKSLTEANADVCSENPESNKRHSE